MKDGKVNFQVNQNGRKTIIQSAGELPNAFKVKASLLTGGKMTLSVDDKQVAEGKTEGLFAHVPEGVIRVGHNRSRQWGSDALRPNVGDYPEVFHFTGELANTRLVAVNLHRASEFGKCAWW